MLATDHGTLRRRALALFALVVVLDLAYVWLGRGMGGQPELTYGLDVEPSEALGLLVPTTVGLWLTWLRPTHPIGWLLMACGLCLAVIDAGQMYGARALVMPEEGLPGGRWVLSLTAPLWIPAVFIPATLLLVRYPTGEIVGQWPRRFDRLAVLGFVPLYAGYAMHESSVTDVVRDRTPPVHPPSYVADSLALLGAGLVLLATVCIVLDGIRRAIRRPEERAALLLVLLTAVAAILLSFGGPAEWFSDLVWQLILVAVAVGVLRYQALGIEVVVRRTLIYATLTGLVLVIFVGIVAGLAQFLPSGPVPQLLAAVVIAVGLGPAHNRIQGLIDRMLYGERSEPWSALRRLGGTGGETGTVLLRDVVAALAGGLHVAGARIEGPDGSILAAQGEVPDDAQAVPLVLAGEEVGVLRLAPRRGESSLGPADLRLLEGVAPLVAAVIQSGRLSDDLRAERTRVLEATHSERGRLRQDLHDGLGPSLTGIGLGLEALQSRVTTDDDLVTRLRVEVSAALEEIRRIIDDLRPTALDDHGLVGALRNRVDQVSGHAGLDVRLDAPDVLAGVPPEVELAAFRIADEALTNVVRHAHARHCTVRVSADGEFHLAVTDDGCGVGSGRADGVGLASMRDRAERLGGRFTLTSLTPGTEVRVELPLGATS